MCDACKTWQHLICMQGDENADVSKAYHCEMCRPRALSFDVQIPRTAKMVFPEFRAAVFGASHFRLGEYVYAGTSKQIIVITKIFLDTDTKTKKISGYEFFRRDALPNAIAADNIFNQELAVTNFECTFELQHVSGKCVVMDANSYKNGRPTYFPDEDIYLCRWRYETDSGALIHHNISKKWFQTFEVFEFTWFKGVQEDDEDDDDDDEEADGSGILYGCPAADCKLRFPSLTNIKAHIRRNHQHEQGLTQSSIPLIFLKGKQLKPSDPEWRQIAVQKGIIAGRTGFAGSEKKASSKALKRSRSSVSPPGRSSYDAALTMAAFESDEETTPVKREGKPKSRTSIAVGSHLDAEITSVFSQTKSFIVSCQVDDKIYRGVFMEQGSAKVRRPFSRDYLKQTWMQRRDQNQTLLPCSVFGCSESFKTISELCAHLGHHDKDSS